MASFKCRIVTVQSLISGFLQMQDPETVPMCAVAFSFELTRESVDRWGPTRRHINVARTITAFIGQARSNSALQSSLEKAVTRDEVAAIAKEQGYDAITSSNELLGGQDLEAVTGGLINAGTVCSMATCNC